MKSRAPYLSEHQVSDNLWTPWVRPPIQTRVPGAVRVIIPTGGFRPSRLQECVQSVFAAAGSVPVRVVLVWSRDGESGRNQGSAPFLPLFSADRIEHLTLPGGFNYCRSINAGLALPGDEPYFLLMNDDASFTRDGDLERLLSTLCAHGWAAAGPWIEHGDGHDQGVPRTAGSRQMDRPLYGSCVLWDYRYYHWLGPYDEGFGEGWGTDESDYHLRALRERGATWGREDTVLVKHDNHASFGEVVGSPRQRQNLDYWHRKWGSVSPWGGTPEWQPLPGVTVSMSAWNTQDRILDALESTREALAGHRWILGVGDDGSSDHTYAVVRHWMDAVKGQASAPHHLWLRGFPKARSVGEAKNRALNLTVSHRRGYPAVFLMDSDDVMLPARAREQLWRTRDAGVACSISAYQRENRERPEESGIGVLAPDQCLHGGITPCTTIFHERLIPADGRLFDENAQGHEDSRLFLHWWLSGLRPLLLPDLVSVRYISRPGSVTQNPDWPRIQREWLAYRQELLSLYSAP